MPGARLLGVAPVEPDGAVDADVLAPVVRSAEGAEGVLIKGDVMSVVKIIEVVGRSSTSSDDAVKSALAEASRSLRNIKALDVVSVGLRGDDLSEWGALVRISFLVDNVTD